MKQTAYSSKTRAIALAAMLAALAIQVTPAMAAPTLGASDMTFYNIPSPLPTSPHGTLISYRPATVNLGTGAPGTKAWNVLYTSTDSLGAANVVTGTVFVPTAAWTGSGTRPMISYAVGTHGLAQSCAPSLQYAAGTDYENANIAAALKAGYAVLVTDYAGYTNTSNPTYLAGASQGQAVLDMFSAATQIPSVGLSASSKSAIWGYSQGGQSAAWAGELKTTYAPNVNLVGVAAGGIPANFEAAAANLDGNVGSAFLLEGVLGLWVQYPQQIPLISLAAPATFAQVSQLESMCVFQSLFTYMDKTLSDYTVNNETLAQVETIPSVGQTLMAQDLGSNKMPVPLYQYHGLSDEFIPLAQDIALKKAYCSNKTAVEFVTYPGEHIGTQFQAAPYVLSWLADRFAGKAAPSNCSDAAPTPQPTANPGGGDLTVTLNQWPLTGTVGLKTLGQTITLPSASTFTAQTDLSNPALSGTLTVPALTTVIKLAGIPVTVKVGIAQVGAVTGTTSLDNAGLLHVHGNLNANITVTSLGEGTLQIPTGCQTTTPVAFPLNFDGPVSSLGNGNLVFSGTTTFPSLSGCGSLFGPLLSALMSGAGQTYTFTVAPPAPVAW